ncbi:MULTISPECIES: DUF3579 domain-containing protein [Tepidiphilus]|jgi:hypothetical protein|uniref:DUF3579 domain-containing protein n=1 Tax=Tepidiphilus baoligensis TaxID=2698687 RepID=A0ABX1QP80_9PROT|nr:MULTISPECIES: DUF3579 domain-containing protein [Tepidiphilus]NMH16951.1 DUF3579 domain-containing protein [Tepidiphilus baoligensis]
MKPNVHNFLIIGLTSEGKRFRPSDWAERLCGIMSQFGADHKMRYSPYVQPGPDENGAKTVRVDARLYDIEPLAYHFLLNFAKDNDLQLRFLEEESSISNGGERENEKGSL